MQVRRPGRSESFLTFGHPRRKQPACPIRGMVLPPLFRLRLAPLSIDPWKQERQTSTYAAGEQMNTASDETGEE